MLASWALLLLVEYCRRRRRQDYAPPRIPSDPSLRPAPSSATVSSHRLAAAPLRPAPPPPPPGPSPPDGSALIATFHARLLIAARQRNLYGKP